MNPRNLRTVTFNLTWDEQKDKLLSMFPVLMEEDLKFDVGKKYVLVTELCTKLGVSRKEILDIITTSIPAKQ